MGLQPTMGRLQDRVVIVTGAACGLGAAIAEACLTEAACVALADADARALDDTVHRLHEVAPNRVIPVQTDVTKERSVERMVRATLDVFKRLDVLVSNADIAIAGDITEFDARDWRRVIKVNLVGYFLCAKHAARAMKERGGAIVQINSQSGRLGSSKNSAYAASMFGGIGLTQSLALELAPCNIRVNAVCPGDLADSLPRAEKRGAGREAVPAKDESQVPLGRRCTYADATEAVLFLASDEAAYITGEALNVDGGQVMS